VNSIEAYQSSCAAGQPDINSFQQCKALLQDIWTANQQATNWKRLIRVEQVCDGLTQGLLLARGVTVVFTEHAQDVCSVPSGSAFVLLKGGLLADAA